MSVVQFDAELSEIQKQYNDIKNLISHRSDLIANNKRTSQIESSIKSSFDKIASSVASLMTSQSKNTSLSIKEANRRLSQIQHWARLIDTLKKSYEERLYSHLAEENKSNLPQSDSVIDVSHIDEGKLTMITNEKINKQEEMLDELHSLLTITKNNNLAMKDEMSKHKPMLEQIDKGIDSVHSQIKTTEKKLNTYDSKSSNCCLIAIMYIEIILIVLNLIYL